MPLTPSVAPWSVFLFALLAISLVVFGVWLRYEASGGYEALGVVTWVVFSIYTLWNVAGAAVFVASAIVVVAVLSYVVRRRTLSKRATVAAGILIGAVIPLLAVALDGRMGQALFVYDSAALAGSVLPGIAGFYLVSVDNRPILTVFNAFVVLPILYLSALWFWVTPPCTSCQIFDIPPSAFAPFYFLINGSDASTFVRLWTNLELPIVQFVSVTATGIGTLVFIYILLSMIGHIFYTSQKGVEKVEDLSIVLVSIASENVRDVLFESIEHNRALFDEYDFHVLIDEGADLQPELEEMDVDLAVVPDSFESDAIAKGRAMQYFVEEYVDEDEWYAFIDDDNLVQGRQFLYEIPVQEAEGKLVMNSVLIPRKGGSTIAFAIDHMRTLFDFTFFRACTGLFGRPYAGLHGELLCARGDVLKSVGFDRPSIVEDFVFADELIRRDIRTWQSQTATSILSPHTLGDYFTQRSRWFMGKVAWLPRSSPGVILVTGLIQGIWLFGIFGGWLIGGMWFAFGAPIDAVYIVPAIFSSAVYTSIYSIGIARMGVRHLPKVLLVPVYATVEHAAPYVSMLKNPDEFEVIKK